MFRNSPKKLLQAWLLFLGLAVVFSGTPLGAQDPEAPTGEFFQIRAESAEGKTRVFLKVRNPVRHTVFSLTNPNRIVINLTPCLLKIAPIPELKSGPIQRLRCSQFDEKTVRLVLDLNQKTPFSIATPGGDPYQLRIELEEPEKKTETPAPAKISKQTVPASPSRARDARGTRLKVKKSTPSESRAKKTAPAVSQEPVPEARPSEPLLETGRVLMEQKRYAQGRDVFFRYLNVVPPEELDLRVVEEIYRSYRLEGDALQGEKVRRQILQAFSQAHGAAARPALIQLADFYVESRQSSLALPLIDHLKSQPRGKNAELLQSRIRSTLLPELEGLFKKADYKEVIRLFYQYHEDFRDSPDPRLFVLLGKSFKALGLTDPALRFFQAAWQRGAQDPQEMHLDWAEVFIENGDLGSALPLLRKLLDHPSAADHLKQRATLLLAQGWHRQRNYGEALKLLEESISRYPSPEAYPERWYLLGHLYSENPGSSLKAAAALRLFIGLSQDPFKTASAYERIGDLCFREGKFAEAREAFQKAQQTNARPASPFLTQKIIQCRLLLDPKGPGSNPANPSVETDPFWTRLYETRAVQQALEKKISELRLN